MEAGYKISTGDISIHHSLILLYNYEINNLVVNLHCVENTSLLSVGNYNLIGVWKIKQLKSK